jgi:hypothetical protein
MTCPRCGAAMVLRNSIRFRYANGFNRQFWSCPRYPECRTTCGAHPDGRPSSAPADDATRLARIRAHAAFDELWMGGRMSRKAAYRWLQRAMNLTVAQAHIGFLDAGQCERLVGLLASEAAPRAR